MHPSAMNSIEFNGRHFICCRSCVALRWRVISDMYCSFEHMLWLPSRCCQGKINRIILPSKGNFGRQSFCSLTSYIYHDSPRCCLGERTRSFYESRMISAHSHCSHWDYNHPHGEGQSMRRTSTKNGIATMFRLLPQLKSPESVTRYFLVEKHAPTAIVYNRKFPGSHHEKELNYLHRKHYFERHSFVQPQPTFLMCAKS